MSTFHILNKLQETKRRIAEQAPPTNKLDSLIKEKRRELNDLEDTWFLNNGIKPPQGKETPDDQQTLPKQ